jgi:hypothetical protein
MKKLLKKIKLFWWKHFHKWTAEEILKREG